MNHKIAQEYKAEVLIRLSPPAKPFRFAINGGCGLASKCYGAGDYIAEQIQMPLLNSGVLTASWIPRKYHDGNVFISTFAGYEEPDKSFIRFDNAHNRDELHLDINYRG